jgi:four helix bundle protein
MPLLLSMQIKHFRELRCWQLSHQLRREVNAICATDQCRNDFRFCNSFRDAAGSVCHNISEGFERKLSGDIVQFFRYALASLAEVQDHLEESLTRQVINRTRFDALWDLSEHTKAVTIRFKSVHDRKVAEDQRKRRRKA